MAISQTGIYPMLRDFFGTIPCHRTIKQDEFASYFNASAIALLNRFGVVALRRSADAQDHTYLEAEFNCRTTSLHGVNLLHGGNCRMMIESDENRAVIKPVSSVSAQIGGKPSATISKIVLHPTVGGNLLIDASVSKFFLSFDAQIVIDHNCRPITITVL